MAGLTHAPWQGGYKWTLFRKFVDSSMPTTMASFSTQHCFHLGVWQCIVYTISWGLFSGTVVSSVVNALQRDHALVGRSLCAQQAFHVKKPAWNLPSVGCAMFERILNVILWSLPSGRSKHHDFASLTKPWLDLFTKYDGAQRKGCLQLSLWKVEITGAYDETKVPHGKK